MADSIFDLLKSYDTSIAPLKATYQQQAAQGPTGMFANVDPVMLGLAQGFLSPTKTGGFGESLGAGLAGAQAPLEALRKRQLTAQEKLVELEAARAKMAMDIPYRAAMAEYYGSGGSRGNSGNREERLYYTTLVNDVNKLEWDDTDRPVNPQTLQPFTSEAEMNQFKNRVRQKLYSLGGGDESAAPKGDDGDKSKSGGEVAPQGALKPMTDEVKSIAQDAIKKGAPKSAVIQRLKEQGFSAEGLE